MSKPFQIPQITHQAFAFCNVHKNKIVKITWTQVNENSQNVLYEEVYSA